MRCLAAVFAERPALRSKMQVGMRVEHKQRPPVVVRAYAAVGSV